MPITPFHFGPGLLLKGLGRRWFSLSSFVVSQVVIDCETVYWIARNRWPWHRGLHTFLGGALVGVAVAVLVRAVLWPAARRIGRLRNNEALARDVRFAPALAGGVIGGVSHSLLDGVMHPDIQPLRPFSPDNPLLDRIGLLPLHLGCVIAGVAGLLLLLLTRRR